MEGAEANYKAKSFPALNRTDQMPVESKKKAIAKQMPALCRGQPAHRNVEKATTMALKLTYQAAMILN